LQAARRDLKQVRSQSRRAEQLATELDEMAKDEGSVQAAIQRLDQRAKALAGDGGKAKRREKLKEMHRLAMQIGVQSSVGGGLGRTIDEEMQADARQIEHATRARSLLDPRTVEEKAEAAALRTKIAARDAERFEVQLTLRMKRSE